MPSLRSRSTLTLSVTLVVIWATAAVEIERSEASQRQLAESAVQLEAQSFSRNTQLLIERINELLLDLRGNWSEHPEQFATLLQRRQSYISDIAAQVSVIDSDGYLAFSNLQPLAGRTYLGDREHFRVHRDGGGDHLYISTPVVGKVSQRATLQFTRPVFTHDVFSGVIVISIPPELLSRLDSSTVASGSSVSLIVRSDGALLAQGASAGPVAVNEEGKSLRTHDVADVISSAIAALQESGHFQYRSQEDGIDRFYGFRRIPEYALVGLIARPVASVMAPFSSQRKTILLTAGATSAFIVVALVLLLRHASARERAEKEVQRSREMLSSSIDAIGEAFVIYDADDRLAYCNEGYRQLYTTSAAAITVGEKFEDMLRYGLARGQYRDAVGREDEWLRERMAAHRNTNSDRVQQLDSGRWLRVRERRTREGYVVGFRIDITELIEAQHTAEHARAVAEDANRTKSVFLANMSHELRTPLNGIIGLSEILTRSELNPMQQELLQLLRGCNTQLRTLVADLLEFSALETGDMELRQQVFSPETLSRSVLDELADRAAASKSVHLQVVCTPEVPRKVRADADRLRQVLRQLLDNAYKFTAEGNIEIRISAERLPASGSVLLRFAIQDSGIGIADADLNRIFQSFTQLDGSSTRHHGGMGLGLSLASGIVERLGGAITVESRPGAGSLFSFALKVESVDETQEVL